MIAVLKQLATCTRYLFVRSSVRSDKLIVDIYLPAILAAATCVVVIIWPRLLPLLGEHGLLTRINGLLQVLVGFYVAALAAVSTFPNASMDQDAKNLTFRQSRISRREFLASIFGYLALLGFTLYLSGVFSDVFLGWFKTDSFLAGKIVARGVLSLAYLFMFWQMLAVTFLGIHYLVDRIHRTN